MPRRSAFRTWLQLFRAPNLLTVPGDPLAGYFLACFGAVEATLWPAMAASLCFYAGGLLLNDLADLREDGAERPERPLPSGAAQPRVVALIMGALFAVGLLLCWQIERATLATGSALLLAIAAYNLFTKRLPIIGALNMGACRGLSVLLGATAVSHGDLTYGLIVRGRLDHLVIAVALVVFYIAAVTNLARFETKVAIPRAAKWLPPLMLGAGALTFLGELSPSARVGPGALSLLAFLPEVFSSARMAPGALFLLAFISAMQVTLQMVRQPAAPIPTQIGLLIRLLLIIQAALCAALGGIESSLAAAILVLLWPLSRLLGRWFYAS